MDWEGLAKVLGVVVPAVLALLTFTRDSGLPTRLRKRMSADAEAAGKLPDGPARDLLLAYVVEEVAQLRRIEQETTRNIPLTIFALVGAGGFGYLSVISWLAGDWWWRVIAVLLGVLTLVFVFGIFDSAQRKPKVVPPGPSTP